MRSAALGSRLRLRCSPCWRWRAAAILPLASAAPSALTPLTVGLTYVPNIQFAPFYVAEQLGYYKAAGLDVTLRHHNVGEDEFAALVAGQENVIFASGDEVLAGARPRGCRWSMSPTSSRKYPVALIVPASSSDPVGGGPEGPHHRRPRPVRRDLHRPAGAAQERGPLDQSDVKIQSIGYTQVPALIGHKVDAVMGYVNNEPIQFQKAGFAVRTFPAVAREPLVSNGLAAQAGEADSAARRHQARSIAATLKGVDYTIAHPQEAVNAQQAIRARPDRRDRRGQRARGA